ncbi:MAG: magnesium transporter [Vallitaleaceae bacterium]|nr:magnesium transporter [Vallitaleaceae bacterium]
MNLGIDELRNYLEEKQYTKIKSFFIEMHTADIAELMEELTVRESLLVYRLIPKDKAAEVFPLMDVDRQSELTGLVSEEELKHLIEEMYFDDMIDLIEELPANVVKRILKNSSNQQRTLINQFLNYPESSAGSLMTIEFVSLKKEMTVVEAMKRIRRTGIDKETIYTCYVTDKSKKLYGIVSLKNLVLSEEDQLVEEIMNEEFISVQTHEDQEVIAELFKKYDFLSIPVVDQEMRIVGIITIDDIVDVIEEETTEDFQRMAAIEPTDDEYMSMSAYQLARKRIIWLIALMFSATISQLITDNYYLLTAQFTFLVGVMPMLMSTSGNAGAQSSTLIIRGLTLGDIEYRDVFKVVWKEFRVGIIMGIILGILNFLRIAIVSKNFLLGMIVGFTLIGTTVMSALMGGLLPIVAKKAKLDPAIMASPLITTITDATTLLIFFSIANYVLNRF